MTRAAFEPLLNHVRRVAGGSADRLSDKQWLERFRATGDPATFAAIVRRHGRLVLAACRTVLSDEADIEDAFQATFLVLLKRTSEVRWQSSLGGWLYGVAHRIALHSRREAARRRQKETRAGRERTETLEPIDPTWREACSILHDELNRLPDRFRLPLMLCYLHGLSRDEAAAKLGWTAGSVKGRLERGRERLRERLIRRGINLTSGLLAAVTSETKAAVPDTLAKLTVEAAVGSPSAAVAALVGAVTRTGFSAPVFLPSGLAAVGLVFAVTLIGRTPVGLPQGPATTPKMAQAAAAPQEPTVIRGRVLSPDGKPVAGAKLYRLARRDSIAGVFAQFLSPRPITTTDTDGRFTFPVESRPANQDSSITVVATAAGFGPDWTNAAKPGGDGELTLRLVPDDVLIRGRVVDLEGLPIAGATARIEWVEAAAENNLSSLLKAASQNEPNWTQFAVPRRLQPSSAGLPGSVKADADGRFEIRGVGRDRIVVVCIEGSAIERKFVRVITRPRFDPKSLDPPAGPRVEPGYDRALPRPTVYGPEFVHSARPSQVVAGRVTDKANGQPLAGIGVNGTADNGWWEDVVHRTTDSDGRYRLVGLPKVALRHIDFFTADAGSAYLNASCVVNDLPGVQPITFDVGLLRGVVITGRITDKLTGKPIADVGVQYLPLAGNSFYRQAPGNEPRRMSTQFVTTGADGRFRTVALPGPGLILAQVNVRGDMTSTYSQVRLDPKDKTRTTQHEFGPAFTTADGHLEFITNQSDYRVIEPAAGANDLTCDMQFDPGRSVSGSVVDPDGKPIAGCRAVGLTATWDHAKTLPSATFRAIALDAEEPRSVGFLHKDRNLAAVIRLSGADSPPPVVKLQQCGSLAGRVLDADGNPLVGGLVQIFYRDQSLNQLVPNIRPFGPATETDRDGRFRVDGLIAGQSLGVAFRHKGIAVNADKHGDGLVIKSGTVTEMGDIHTRPYR